MKRATEYLRRLGEGLTVPVAALPAAGVMLRIGQPDLLGGVSAAASAAHAISAAGGAVLDYLPLLFAVGAVAGLHRRTSPHLTVAGIVAYLAASRVILQMNPIPAGHPYMPPSQQPYGALVGILAGILTFHVWGRLEKRNAPPFASHAAVLVSALALGSVLGLGFPSVNAGLVWVARQLASHAILGGAAFGVLNRGLLPIGLHQIVNSVMWFVAGDCGNGIHGDIPCFLVAHSPSAGVFTTGFFPISMGALPGAALAMWRTARPDQRKRVGQLLGSAAFMSFCCGVTEPIELLFAFTAWPLYITHCILTGTSLALANALNVHSSFVFSSGALDFALNYRISTRPLLLLPLAAVYGLLYFLLFRWAILRFDLQTPGRRASSDQQAVRDQVIADEQDFPGADKSSLITDAVDSSDREPEPAYATTNSRLSSSRRE